MGQIGSLGNGNIRFEIREYLGEPFIKGAITGGIQKVERGWPYYIFDMEMAELDVPVSDAKNKIIL